MTEGLVEAILLIIYKAGYPGVFLAALIETFLVFIPSEAILPMVGILVARGHMSLAGSVAAAGLGSYAGAARLYFIGLRAGKPSVERYGRLIGVMEREYARAERLFQRHGPKIVFLGRMLPGIRSAVALIAGVAGMRPTVFSIYAFLGGLPWCLALVCIGAVLGDEWRKAAEYVYYLD